MPTLSTSHINESSETAEPRLSRAASFYGSRTEVGHVREHNEDSLLVLPPLFAVADGMGGHEAGEVASELTIKALAELAPASLDADALERAVVAANLNVIKAPHEGIGRVGMGTTLTCAMIEKERLIIAQVGDSRAYLLHQGTLQQLTRDHSLMADMIEAGQLTEAEARVHPNRSVITRAIGSDPHMKPDIYELNVSTGDRILLCSDGICTMIEDHEIESIMAHSASAQDCADALVEAALAAGGYDNATAVVVDVEGSREAQERKAAKKSKAFIATIIAVVLVAFGLAGFGAWQYVDHSAYLVEQDGKVAVYRGLNDQILGVSLSHLEKTTDIEVDKLQPGLANRIKEGMVVEGGIDGVDALLDEYAAEIERNSSAATATDEPAARS